MEDELLPLLTKAINDTWEEFIENEKSIFSNETELSKQIFAATKHIKKWRNNTICIVRGCNQKSIKSHSIQKSGSIASISENGHVLTPRYNKKIGKIEIVRIGVKEASTFPGFCTFHENMFNPFETIKDFQAPEHLRLQLYRTICREIMEKHYLIKEGSIELESYKLHRNNKFKEVVSEKCKTILTESFKPMLFAKVTIKYTDTQIAAFNRVEKICTDHLRDFLYKYEKGILDDLKNQRFNKISYVAIKFDKEIPVALSGSGCLNLQMKTTIKTVNVIYNVLPLDGETYIFISSLKKHALIIRNYMSKFANPLNLVSMVESWMIYGTDHWFLRPSVWSKIQPIYQAKFREEIMKGEISIVKELEETIFNDLKSESINLMEMDYDQLEDVHIELLKKEKAKLTII